MLTAMDDLIGKALCLLGQHAEYAAFTAHYGGKHATQFLCRRFCGYKRDFEYDDAE